MGFARSFHRKIRKTPGCILCGRPSTCIGIFIPDQRIVGHQFGFIKPETRRHFIYHLCDRCAGHPDAAQKVEDVIERQMNAQGVVVAHVLPT